MAYNPAADFYDNSGIRYQEAYGHDAGLHRFIQVALQMLLPNATVLDIGSGTGGPTSSTICSSGRRVFGIDFSSVMTELSRQQVPMGSFEQLNMLDHSPRGPFDAAFAIFSTFHLTRDEITALAAKWSEWIVPDGFILSGPW